MTELYIYIVYPRNHAHGFIAVLFVVVIYQFLKDWCDPLTFILQGYFIYTGGIRYGCPSVSEGYR